MFSRTDLDAYFERIAYGGPAAPTLATLAALQVRQPDAIAFENLDVLLGRPIQLDPAALHRKLVAHGRGGYCFEQNGLLLAVLRSLGFQATGLAGRVRFNMPAERVTGRSHMMIRVDLPEGPYLVDVGFGGLTQTIPLAMVADLEQASALDRHRLHPVPEHGAGEIMLQSWIDGSWSDVVRFAEVPQLQIDYEMASWFTSTHPNSLFVSNLLATRTRANARLRLFNDELTTRFADGRVEVRPLTGLAAVTAVLQDEMRLNLDGLDLAPLGRVIRS